jgi:hypothetical protein
LKTARTERAFEAPTTLFALESDAFFASGVAERALEGRTVDLAFVDGLHLFEQALRDFIHIEEHSTRETVVLFHDCLPLTAATAARRRSTGFWTGDVWKIAPILRERRPDLEVFLIPAYPTGLLVVTNLDPGSRALEAETPRIVDAWTPREWTGGPSGPPIAVVANDWAAVRARLPISWARIRGRRT